MVYFQNFCNEKVWKNSSISPQNFSTQDAMQGLIQTENGSSQMLWAPKKWKRCEKEMKKKIAVLPDKFLK